MKKLRKKKQKRLGNGNRKGCETDIPKTGNGNRSSKDREIEMQRVWEIEREKIQKQKMLR